VTDEMTGKGVTIYRDVHIKTVVSVCIKGRLPTRQDNNFVSLNKILQISIFLTNYGSTY
jgi:hypothetical protein